MKLYICEVVMSSGNFIEDSEDLDEFRRETTYTFDKETRQKIQKTRQRYKGPLYASTVAFHKLHICGEDQMTPIAANIQKADAELKQISDQLEASVTFWPLQTDEIVKGELYQAVVGAIKYRVFKDVFERLSEILERDKGLPARSKAALLAMCSQLEKLNLVNDGDITRHISEIRSRIESESIEPLRDILRGYLSSMSQRYAVLETKTEGSGQSP